MRRFLYTLGIVLLCIVLTLAVLFAIFLNSKVQTSAVRSVLQELSCALETDMEVGGVEYSFPNKLTITDLYIADQQSDTLLYIDTVRARFSLLGFFHKKILFSSVELRSAYVNAYTIADGTDSFLVFETPALQNVTKRMNYDFLLEAFMKEDDGEKKEMSSVVEVKNVKLSDLRLRYDNLRVKDINSSLDLYHYSKDSLHAAVNSLSFKESGGFELVDFSTELYASRDRAEISGLSVKLPNSEFKIRGGIVHDEDCETSNPVTGAHAEGSKDNMFTHLFDLVHLTTSEIDLHIEKAELTPKDIGRFVPKMSKMHGVIGFTADVTGRLNNLCASNVTLSYKGKEVFEGDIDFYGLPNLDTAYVHAELIDLSLNRAVMQDFFSDMKGAPYLLPDNLAKLGNMHYSGTVDGRLDSLTLNGQFSSRLGKITTRGGLLIDTIGEQMTFHGRIETKRFDVGKLVDNNDLGSVAFYMSADAVTGNNRSLQASVKGKVYALDFKGYTYRNITINGDYARNRFNGNVKIDDDNIGVEVAGLLDLSGSLPVVNMRAGVGRLNLGALHLTDRYDDLSVTARLSIDGSGNDLDNLDGYLYIDSLRVERLNKSLFMKQLRLVAESGEGKRTTFKINSDFLNANLAGDYKYTSLRYTFQRLLAQYVPKSLSDTERKLAEKNGRKNTMEFYAYFKDLDKVAEVLDLPFIMPGMPTMKGLFDEYNNKHQFQVVVPKVYLGNKEFDNITLNLDNKDNQLNLAISAYKHAATNAIARKLGDINALVEAIARNDSLYLDLSLRNTEEAKMGGMLRTATYFSEYAGRPLIDCHILPCEMMFSDSIWSISDSHIVYTAADTILEVNRFRLGSRDEYIYADGLASKSASDAIDVEVNNILLEYISEFTNIKSAIGFSGGVSGVAKVYSVFSSPMFEAELWASDAHINDYLIGDAHAVARLNKLAGTIDIEGEVVEGEHQVAVVDGVINPSTKLWDLNIYPDSINLGFISRWTDSFLGEITGRASGWVHVYGLRHGNRNEVYLEGKAYAEDAILGIELLGSRYHMTDSVSIGLDNITFDNVILHDDYGNEVRVNGVVHHRLFNDFEYEIEAAFDNALIMELPENKTDLFYGHVFGTGAVRVSGDVNECKITGAARTEKNSSFSFSTATASTASESNFITFVDSRVLHSEQDVSSKSKNNPDTRVLVDVQIEGTPDVEVSIVIDPKTGDKLCGRGEGNVRFQYDVSTDEINLFGTYKLNSGTFHFTLENLFRKEFTIRDGSVVTFSGNPDNLEVDASAVYSTTASLRDLFGTDYENVATNRSSVPVNCIIYLRDNLFNPIISFGIELPQSDESVASQVKSIINTDDMMTRQMIYLLVFNRFYTPEYLQSTTSYGLNETYSLLTSTVTSQINNWIRQLTNNFTIGFNIRAEGFDSGSEQEYETQFQYTPNNRLIINGNFGYRYNDISDQPVFGNLDVEYLLTPSGMWRAKAYTHTIDKYSLREAHTQQGVGIMFKYDFNGDDGKAKKSAKRGKEKE